MKRRLALALAGGALCLSRPALANPADLFGFGARGPARGNAMVAEADASSSPIYNAAAGSFAKSLEILAGYTYAVIDMNIDGRDANLMNAHGSWGAFAIPFQIGPVRLAYAMALYMPDQFVLRLYSPPATEQRMVMWDNQPHRIIFSTALSARIGDVFAIGLGISGLGDANGVVDFDLGTRPGRAVSDSSINASLPTRFAPVVGIIVTPNENLRFGLRYTEELALHVKLDSVANVNVEGTAAQNGTTLVRSFGTEYFTPREIAAGGSIDIGALTLSGELAWQQWSRIDNVSYDVELQVDLGVDTPVHAFHAPPPGYHDVFVPHLGADYRIPIGANRQLVPRAGFWFAPSPVPEQTGVTNYGDADRVVFTAGAGFRFEDLGFPITAELAVQLHHLLDRENHKKDPVQPGGDFSVGGNAYVGAFGLRAEF